MTTNVYAAKGALIDRLQPLTGVGQDLAGVQIEYAAPGQFAEECVYGGGVRFQHEDATAERAVLMVETALISIYIRVTRKLPATVRETDARAREIFAAIAGHLVAQPALAGGMSFAAITQGQGDYNQTDDEVWSILAVQVSIESDLTYGVA